jgi:hypothetical protein
MEASLFSADGSAGGRMTKIGCLKNQFATGGYLCLAPLSFQHGSEAVTGSHRLTIKRFSAALKTWRREA